MKGTGAVLTDDQLPLFAEYLTTAAGTLTVAATDGGATPSPNDPINRAQRVEHVIHGGLLDPYGQVIAFVRQFVTVTVDERFRYPIFAGRAHQPRRECCSRESRARRLGTRPSEDGGAVVGRDVPELDERAGCDCRS